MACVWRGGGRVSAPSTCRVFRAVRVHPISTGKHAHRSRELRTALTVCTDHLHDEWLRHGGRPTGRRAWGPRGSGPSLSLARWQRSLAVLRELSKQRSRPASDDACGRRLEDLQPARDPSLLDRGLRRLPRLTHCSTFSCCSQWQAKLARGSLLPLPAQCSRSRHARGTTHPKCHSKCVHDQCVTCGGSPITATHTVVSTCTDCPAVERHGELRASSV